VQLWPALDVAVYEVTAEPPSFAGAVQETVETVFPPVVAVTEVGASGLVIAIIICGSSVIEMTALPSTAATPRSVVLVPITE
jgi:hypothetical protein